MPRRLAVRGIIIKDSELLCVKLKPYNNFVRTDFWCTPGGNVDDGESLLPALEREMLEETGVQPVIGNLLYVQQFKNNDAEHIEFFFHIENSDDYLNVDLSKTTHGLKEIEEIAFINTKENDVLPKFLMTEPLTIKQDQIPKFFSYL